MLHQRPEFGGFLEVEQRKPVRSLAFAGELRMHRELKNLQLTRRRSGKGNREDKEVAVTLALGTDAKLAVFEDGKDRAPKEEEREVFAVLQELLDPRVVDGAKPVDWPFEDEPKNGEVKREQGAYSVRVSAGTFWVRFRSDPPAHGHPHGHHGGR